MTVGPMFFAPDGLANADPFWSSVVARLSLDGTNGSTTFTDGKGHAFNSVNGAALSTAEKKFGTASLLLNGSNQAIDSPNSADWEMGGGNFTLEAWIRPAAAITSRGEIIVRWASNNGLGMQVMDSGVLRAFAQNSTSGVVTVLGATVVTHSEWHHVAFVRDGNTLRLFLDGVSQATATFTGSIAVTSVVLSIGRDPSGIRYFNGNIDDVRITRGVARYTANFTLPAEAFP